MEQIMNDNKDPNIKDVAETATKLLKEIKCVVTKMFNDLRTKISEKPASASKTEPPATKTDHTISPENKPVDPPKSQTGEDSPKVEVEATESKSKADDNQDTPK